MKMEKMGEEKGRAVRVQDSENHKACSMLFFAAPMNAWTMLLRR